MVGPSFWKSFKRRMGSPCASTLSQNIYTHGRGRWLVCIRSYRRPRFGPFPDHQLSDPTPRFPFIQHDCLRETTCRSERELGFDSLPSTACGMGKKIPKKEKEKRRRYKPNRSGLFRVWILHGSHHKWAYNLRVRVGSGPTHTWIRIPDGSTELFGINKINFC